MANSIHETALDALEVLIRGVLKCQPNDVLKFTTATKDGLPYVTGYSVTRRLVGPDSESTLCFPSPEFIEHGEKLVPIGDYFISAANMFLQEVLGLRPKGASIEKLIAGSGEINLDKAFSSAAGVV